MLKKCRIAVLVSGGGTNLQAILNAEKSGIIKSGEVVLVASNRPDAYALKRAESAGVETFIFKDESSLTARLRSAKIDLIVLAGFLKILSPGFCREFPERIINIHPALIPSFCGKGCYGLHVHEKVLAAGVKVTGATVHYVNEVPDGGEIIAQKPVMVRDGDTPETLQRRVMEQAEWVILPLCVESVSRRLMCRPDSVESVLGKAKYLGRGIALGTAPDGRAVYAYFISGRSENSRNRIFVEDGDGIVIRPFDESKVSDPSLIIYHPIRACGGHLVVTNGDQTDTIVGSLNEGGTFEEALRTRTYEPDAPNFTPRVSGMLDLGNGAGLSAGGSAGRKDSQSAGGCSYKLSILKRSGENGDVTSRQFFEYEPENGVGHFISTYSSDGDPLPSFEGEPRRIEIPDSPDEFISEIWDSLDVDNRISLVVGYVDRETGRQERLIINKYQK